MRHVFLIDWEGVEPFGTWWIGFACAVATFPEGRILHECQGYTYRPVHLWDDKRRHFWHKHDQAYRHLMEQAQALPDALKQELTLSQFVRDMHQRYPQLEFASDNIGYDMGILNDVLRRQHHLPYHCRSNGDFVQSHCIYTQAICIVKKRLGYQSIQQWPEAYHKIMGKPFPLSKPRGLKHTPTFDVREALHRYIALTEIENTLNKTKKE